MSVSQCKGVQSIPHGTDTDDLQIEESHRCCICNERDNSLDEADPGLTQLLIECLGLDHDTRVNTTEKVGECSLCFNCMILLQEWKFSRDQEAKFRIRIRQLKATLTAKIVESSREDSSWLRLPSRRGKSWSHELRQIVCLNYGPVIRAQKYQRAGNDEPYGNQVSSWHNTGDDVDVDTSCLSPLQNAVKKEIPAIPSSSHVQFENGIFKTYVRNKILSQSNINLTSRGPNDAGGADQGSATVLIPNAECVQGPHQAPTAPALMMENSFQAARTGARPIMNTTTNFVGSSYPRKPYSIQPPVPAFQVSSNNNFATDKIIRSSFPSFAPSGVINNTFASHPYTPNQSAQAPCDMMPKAPGLFPVQDSSNQNPPSVQPVSSFHIMPNVVPRVFPVVANGSGGQIFVANGSGGQFPVAHASRGQLASMNKPARSQTAHTNFRPILPNLQHMVVSTNLKSGGQALEQMQTHHDTRTGSTLIYPSNMTAHLQQIVSAVIADRSSSFQAKGNVSTETTTNTVAPTNSLATKKKRKEPSGTSTRIPTKKASTRQINLQTQQSHIHHNIRLDYMDGKFICGECNKYFDGRNARSHAREHVRKLHLGFPWQSQPVQDLGDDTYLYGNKVPFRKHQEYFICGACDAVINGKKPDSLIIQHISAEHPDLLHDPNQGAVGNDDSSSNVLMGEIKAEVDWETWTDESPENDYADQASPWTQDPFA